MPFEDLPNLHPAVVHFPIALFTTAFALDLVSLMLPRGWLERASLLLYFLSALGAGGTALTGQWAANELAGSLGPEAEHLLGEHSDSAFFTVIVFFLVAGLRGDAIWRRAGGASHRTAGPSKRARLIVLMAALVGQFLVWRTAERGGGLVYRHGVGVDGSKADP